MTVDLEVREGYARGAPIPWWAKIALKIVLSRLPISADIWRKSGIFTHSPDTHGHSRELNNLVKRFRLFEAEKGRKPRSYVEVGVGDTIGRAIVAHAYGLREIVMHDAGSFADRNLDRYRSLCGELRERGMKPVDLDGIRDFDDLLTRTNTTYLTGGLSAFATIADETIDLLVSEAVLEHLPLDEFTSFMGEFHRVLAPGGMAFHGIDFHDHLGGKLNHLRFSRKLWEGRLFSPSGFYTNRLPASDMLQAMTAAGFEYRVLRHMRWPEIPISVAKIHADVNWREEDLHTCTLDVLCLMRSD